MQKIISSLILLLFCANVFSQNNDLNLQITLQNLSINKIAIPKTTIPDQIELILGFNHRTFSYGKFGKSYIYDEQGLAFRWDATGKKLLSVFVDYSNYRQESYLPSKAFTGKLACLGMEFSRQTTQVDLLQKHANLITAAEKDWSELEIDKPKYSLIFNYREDDYTSPFPQNISIFFHHDSTKIDKPLNLSINSNKKVSINGKNAEDLGYEKVEIPPMVTAMEEAIKSEIEMAYEKDSLKGLAIKILELRLQKKNVEADLNVLGYRFIRQKKWKDAVAVLQVNVDNYPDSYNVYDSLGEAQLLNEEADKAFENYQKSLSLSPIGNSTHKNSQKYIRWIEGEKVDF